MIRILFSILALSLSIATLLAQDQKLDAASQEALKKTQELLRNQAERNKAIGDDKNAKAADKRVQDVTGGGANAEDLYGLSADILDSLVKEAGGDSVKLNKLVEEAMRNPAAFAEKFTPEQKAKLKAISEKAQTPAKPL